MVKGIRFLIPMAALIFAGLVTGCYDSGQYPEDFHVISVLPSNNQTNVVQNSQIVIRFTNPPDHRTIEGTKQIILVDQSNSLIPVTYSYNGELLTLTPTSPLGQAATYGVAIRPGVQDIYGNTIAMPYSATFSTGSSVAVIQNFPPFTINTGTGPNPGGTPGTFTATAPMVYARARHRMTRLIDGRILCTGGENDAPLGRVLQSAELFDQQIYQWTLSQSLGTGINGMHYQRYGHTSTLLKDGKVLITGGTDNHKILNIAEIYDPKNDIFSVVAARMQNHRVFHTANLIDNGNVILCAGWENSLVPNMASQSSQAGVMSYLVDSLEVYDVYAGTFTLTAQGLIPLVSFNANRQQWWSTGPTTATNAGRMYHTSASLPNGNVMICGGYGEPWLPQAFSLDDAQVYEPDKYGSGVKGTMKHAGTNLTLPRVCHTSNVLASGDAAGLVIIFGGFTNSPYQGVITSGEIFDYKEVSTSGIWQGEVGCFAPLAQQMSIARHNHTASLIYGGMNNGGILVTGGAQHLGVQNPNMPTPYPRLYPWVEPTGCGACILTASTDVFMPFGFGKHTTNPFRGVNVTGTMGVTQDINGNTTDMAQFYAAGVYFHAAESFTNGVVLITGGSWCPFCMMGPNAWSTYFTNVVNGIRVNGPSLIYNP